MNVQSDQLFGCNFVTLKTKQQKPQTLTKATWQTFSFSRKHIKRSVWRTGLKPRPPHALTRHSGRKRTPPVTRALPAAAFDASLVQTERASAAGPAAPSSAVSGCPRWLPSQPWPRWWVLKMRRWAQGPRRRTRPFCQGCGAPGGPGALCGHSTCQRSTRKHPIGYSNASKTDMEY